MKSLIRVILASFLLVGTVDAAVFPGFGGGGGSQQQIPRSHASSPFADIAARDTYFTANPAELLNNEQLFTVIFVTSTSQTFRWSGANTPSTYSAGSWQLFGDQTLTQPQIDAIDSVVSTPNGEILMGSTDGVAGTGATVEVVNGLKQYNLDGEINVSSGGGLRFGENDIGGGGNIYGGGSGVRTANSVNSTESYPIISLVTDQGSGQAFYTNFQEQRNDPSPADKSETFTGSPGHRFAFNNPLPGRVTKYTISNPSAITFTGCDFTIWENGYDQDVLFSFSGSSASVVKTFDFPPGDVEVTPPEPIGFPPTGTRIFSEIICDSDNIQLAGQTIPFLVDPTNPTGPTEDVEFPYIEFERNFSTQQFIEDALGNPTADGMVLSSTVAGVRSWITPASAIDVDHPVTLRRDMPTEVDAQALVDASLNNNSALWIVANNQLGTSNRADATIVAQIAGFLDVNGNEIPTDPVAANTIQLRTGTVVRIFSANDYRVVNSPVIEGDIPEPLPPIEINAQEFTITSTNFEDYLDRTIRLTNTNTGVVQVIRFGLISTFLATNPTRDISFSFIVNRGTAGQRADFVPGGSETIGGANNQMRFENDTITIELPTGGTNWLVTSVGRENEIINRINALEAGIILTAEPNGTQVKIIVDDSNPSNIKLGVEEL